MSTLNLNGKDGSRLFLMELGFALVIKRTDAVGNQSTELLRYEEYPELLHVCEKGNWNMDELSMLLVPAVSEVEAGV